MRRAPACSGRSPPTPARLWRAARCWVPSLVGALWGSIEGSGAGATSAAKSAAPAAAAAPKDVNGVVAAKAAPASAPPSAPATSMPPAPSAAKIAAEHNLDLSAVEGSGKRGQVLKGDVLAAIAAPAAPVASPQPVAAPAVA